jgi:hypothetical protein
LEDWPRSDERSHGQPISTSTTKPSFSSDTGHSIPFHHFAASIAQAGFSFDR